MRCRDLDSVLHIFYCRRNNGGHIRGRIVGAPPLCDVVGMIRVCCENYAGIPRKTRAKEMPDI